MIRLISYDIGIKNMAYCIIQYENNNFSILDWNVLNLLEKENPTEICSQINKGKTKKTPDCQCTKTAKYQKNGQFYCEKHAKKGYPFIIPTKKHTRPYLKKIKVNELQTLAKSIFIFENLENINTLKKDGLIDKIAKHYEKQCFEPIIKKKEEKAGDTDLILIGKRMKKLLNENPITETITHVVIENQISPIATRMKTLQGMLTQYYIDKKDDINIDFVSSVNKLKQFSNLLSSIKEKKNEEIKKETKKEESIENGEPSSQKTTYKEHKQLGIIYSKQIIEKNPMFSNWKEKLETKKKDDLADCFLQGLWYFKQKNIISYADDIKINII